MRNETPAILPVMLRLSARERYGELDHVQQGISITELPTAKHRPLLTCRLGLLLRLDLGTPHMQVLKALTTYAPQAAEYISMVLTQPSNLIEPNFPYTSP